MRKKLIVARSLAVLAAVVVLATFALDANEKAHADEKITLRIATLAPRGSMWMRVFDAWNASVKQRTNQKLELRFYPGGVSGDERDFVRKIRAGQLDGAAVTSTGLGLIVRPVLVLQAPGLFPDYAAIDRVRGALGGEFEREFESAGFKLLGWSDVGRARIFSNRPVRKPADLREVRPWAWRDDPIFAEFLRVVGATPVLLGVPEVYPALQTRMVDTVPASALAAVSLQWHTRVTHVTKQSDSMLIGATIIKKDKIDALPEDMRTALLETGRQAHATLATAIRRDDDRAYQTVVSRGLTEVDISAHRSEWEQAARSTREALAGRLYSRELLQRVERALH